MKKYKWIIEITVDKTWVADGFNLTKDRVNDEVRKMLPYALGYEVSARVLASPPPFEIAKEQGYSSVRDMQRADNPMIAYHENQRKLIKAIQKQGDVVCEGCNELGKERCTCGKQKE